MATVGLRYAVFAPITSELRGQPLVYGTGVVVGRAIRADITWDRNDNPLNADDVEVDNDNSLTGGSITFNLDAILKDARKVMFGDYIDSEEGSTEEWEDNTEAAPYGGFGTVSVVRENNQYTYEALWLHKTQFGQTSESMETKGRTINWQTPTINGRIMPVYNNAEGKPRARRRATFTTAGEAIAWLNKLANVTDNANAQAAAEA
jgi:phi13 family phage major tail protein